MNITFSNQFSLTTNISFIEIQRMEISYSVVKALEKTMSYFSPLNLELASISYIQKIQGLRWSRVDRWNSYIQCIHKCFRILKPKRIVIDSIAKDLNPYLRVASGANVWTFVNTFAIVIYYIQSIAKSRAIRKTITRGFTIGKWHRMEWQLTFDYWRRSRTELTAGNGATIVRPTLTNVFQIYSDQWIRISSHQTFSKLWIFQVHSYTISIVQYII